MGDLRKLIKWSFAMDVVGYIQQKSANIFRGTFTELLGSLSKHNDHGNKKVTNLLI